METEDRKQPDDEEAQRLIEEARGRVDELLDDARQEAERIREDACREVIEEMRGRLECELQEAISRQVEAFEKARNALLKQMREEHEGHCAEMEREVAGLVGVMTEKVVRRKIDQDDSIVLEVVKGTIAEAAGAKRFTVRVTAAEEETVRAAQAELIAAADSPEELEIVTDDAVGSGGCIIETERGRFDARIGTQLELLEEEMGRVLGE